MLIIKLAFRNLMGAGLRTWLNVTVLSFSFVVIVFYNGMLDGWNRQAYRDTREWFAGSGQLWHPAYDPYDLYSLQDAHGRIDPELEHAVDNGQLTPVLITQATLYHDGRSANMLLKGIDPSQQILKIPADQLKAEGSTIPAIIGSRMANSEKLKTGDRVLIQWRDKHGTFDAREVAISGVFNTNVPAVDQGQVWIPLAVLQQMTGLTGEATLFVAGENYTPGNQGIWQYKGPDVLLKDIDDIIRTKRTGSVVIYGLLLAIALLAIFDTQVLSIFRRQKEIGTYIALGMTRWKVVRIFTFEGTAYSLLSVLLGAIYGIPLLLWIQNAGIPMPSIVDTMGLSITLKIFPYYSAGLILFSLILVVLSATIVSYFPTRRISKMNPTEALKGKIQ